jgi:probable rRNA maturation factor
MPKLSLLVSTEGHVQTPLTKRDLLRLLNHVLSCELPHCDCQLEISVLFCDDKFISKLNHSYLKRDRPTDVLSFMQLSPSELEAIKGKHECRSSNPLLLGDIVISVERALKQAKRYKHSAQEELMRLVIHGLLHLLGYDDSTKEKRVKMSKREVALLHSFLKLKCRPTSLSSGSA